MTKMELVNKTADFVLNIILENPEEYNELNLSTKEEIWKVKKELKLTILNILSNKSDRDIPIIKILLSKAEELENKRKELAMMHSIPISDKSFWSKSLAVPLVATGMKDGVSTNPWAVFSLPTRAQLLPSSAAIEYMVL